MDLKNRYTLLKVGLLAVVIALGLLAGGRPGLGQPQRREIAAMPGVVGYQEGDSSVRELFASAVALLEERDVEGAEAVYRQIIAAEPANAPGYIGLASCRLLENDLEGARQHYRRALDLAPDSTMALLGLGSVAYQEADYAAAQRYHQQALGVNADLADAHLGLGLAAAATHEDTLALTHLERFLQLAPQSNQAEYERTGITEIQSRQAQK